VANTDVASLRTIYIIVGWVLVELGILLLLIPIVLALLDQWEGSRDGSSNATVGFFGCVSLFFGYELFAAAVLNPWHPGLELFLVKSTSVMKVMQDTWQVGAAVPVVVIAFFVAVFLADRIGKSR
jgi:hypothetical protein